jgi:hypothetical protein
MARKPTLVTARLAFEKETKGAWRYHETDAHGNFLPIPDGKVGVVYLRKSVMKKPAAAITVTVAITSP